MILTVCSLFRDSTRYLDRYFAQVSSIYPLESTRFVFVEGDSTDSTYQRLLKWRDGPFKANTQVIKHDQHIPYYGSVVHPKRLSCLAELANIALDAIPEETDYILWVESDLIFESDLVRHLLLLSGGKHAVAPYIITQKTRQFYDIWAFRKDGVQFNPHKPYIHGESHLFDVDSAGSVLLVPARFRSCRFKTENAIIGWCENLKEEGCSIKAARDVVVWHPA